MPTTVHLHLRNQSVIIRKATSAELIDLRHRVLRANLPRTSAMFPDDDLPTSYHFGAFAAGDPTTAICCASFHLNSWENQPAYQLRGMASEPDWVGQGLGRAVQNLALSTIAADTQIHLFWCNARLVAIPFYKKLGWIIASDLFDIPGAGPHHRMYFRLPMQQMPK